MKSYTKPLFTFDTKAEPEFFKNLKSKQSKSFSIHFDMDGLNIDKFCFTNNLNEVEMLKEKGYSILLDPKSEDGKCLNANFYVLGKESNRE